jgi:hypothetical protein
MFIGPATVFLSCLLLLMNLICPRWCYTILPICQFLHQHGMSELAILSAARFVYPFFCTILSICHFVKLPFCQLAILPACHFASLPFCQYVILSTCHFVNMPFCQLSILSIYCSWTCHFCQLVILSTCHLSTYLHQCHLTPRCIYMH